MPLLAFEEEVIAAGSIADDPIESKRAHGPDGVWHCIGMTDFSKPNTAWLKRLPLAAIPFALVEVLLVAPGLLLLSHGS
jgi:hypothetical protein